MSKELEDAIRSLKKRGVDTFGAKVISVDKTKGTCVVADSDLEYTDVRLSSVIDGSNKKFFLFPVVGSSVLVSPINEDLHNLYVEAYSEIESLDLRIDRVQFLIDKDGFLLKKEDETLKKMMADLFKAIKKMKFTTNTGSTITLVNLNEFVALESRFNQFLK